jgi:hypothetical protein
MAVRYGFFVAIIVAVGGLCVMGWRLSRASALDELPDAASKAITTPVGMADDALTASRLQQASTVANAYLAQNGTLATFTPEAMDRLDPTIDSSVTLAWVNAADACFQAGRGTATMHLAVSTGGPPADGPC